MLIHAATIFLGAFLLFIVQPIIAKQILPWFGGGAAVWATCLVFFQSVLLAAYAYADWTTRRLSVRKQTLLHIALLLISVLLLPIVPDAAWKPGQGDTRGPAYAIMGLLTVTIGLHYFLLSATGPLVQAWYWRRRRDQAPYRLFALSNFASLLALLSYSALVEPVLSLAQQSLYWSAAYVAFAALCATAAYTGARNAPAAARQPDTPPQERPTLGQRALWMALAALGSSVLMAVTNHLTQNIASIPFMWVLPLSLYLVTFILCFDHPRWYRRDIIFPLVAVLVPLMAWSSDSLDLWRAAPLYAAGLFACCMFCHGELYRLRPAPRHLTSFYLMIAAGGALGALLVGIGAPALLNGYYELWITMVACAALLLLRAVPLHRWAAAAAFVVVIVTLGFAVQGIRDYGSGARLVVRNFYGVVRTRDFAQPVPFRVMYHGGINHGGQLLDEATHRSPTGYFGLTSGYGRVFTSLPQRSRRIGVLGLGAGAIAAYARHGDVFRFYEIDPQVAAVATMEFSYLRESPGSVEIVLGDGRLSLEREPDQGYDVLSIDAFSGDSIPLHLLTREAMATYVRHLKPDGVIVFQATNRFVDIAPVVQRLAEEFGFSAVMISDAADNDSSRTDDYWISSTDQIIVTRNAALLEAEPVRAAAQPLARNASFRIWTDDFNNLLRVLK